MSSPALFWIGFKWFVFGLLIGSLAVWWFKDWIRAQAMAVWLWLRSKVTHIPPALFAFLIILVLLPSVSRASQGIAVLGQQITISLTVDGDLPFTYQWKKAGVNITGATAPTYVINAAQLTDAGSYTCQVTNQWGTVLSDAAVITVTGHPPTKATTAVTVTVPQPATNVAR